MLIRWTIFSAMLLVSPTAAHDMYGTWKQPNNPAMSCCSGKDCAPVDAELVYPGADGSFEIPSMGVHVAADKVLPSPDGRYHLCCRRDTANSPCELIGGKTAVVYCFAAPVGF